MREITHLYTVHTSDLQLEIYIGTFEAMKIYSLLFSLLVIWYNHDYSIEEFKIN